MPENTVFVAYPGAPDEIGKTINSGIAYANSESPVLRFHPWEQNDIVGKPIVEPILVNINDSPFFVADITRMNFNVVFEIGYALGKSKKLILVKNSTLRSDDELIRSIGIFDTLGYISYQNSDELSRQLLGIKDHTPLSVPIWINQKTPVYIVETPTKSDLNQVILNTIKKDARMQYRSFIQSEDFRLSASSAINHVASSLGVIAPVLSDNYKDYFIHNIRVAFVAGIAHGLERQLLLLYDGHYPAPLDIRDLARPYKSPDDIVRHVQELALAVRADKEEARQHYAPPPDLLSSIRIGDPLAENEFQSLHRYYLRTSEFTRSVNGEVNLVVGRKGTGKTALFSQIRDRNRDNKANIVVDLKPQGYQLVKLREEIFDYLTEGAKLHLLTAFWEYLLLLEITYKILEKDKSIYMNDHTIRDQYVELEEQFNTGQELHEGDFSERLSSLSNMICDKYSEIFDDSSARKLSNNEVTQLLYAHDIKALRNSVSKYLEEKNSVWILFDNLDKGWERPISGADIATLRTLIDSSRKLQSQMRKIGHEFYCILFIRDDIYHYLLEGSADFGKEMRAALEWSDRDLLLEVLRLRLVDNDQIRDGNFDLIWNSLCVPTINGIASKGQLVDLSLYRPRNIIKLFGHCRAAAVNFQHKIIEEDDFLRGIKNYSEDLVVDADLELRDLEPSADGLIYRFIDEKARWKSDELIELMKKHGMDGRARQNVIEFALYFGLLGIVDSSNRVRFIYDLGYNMQKLFALREKFDPKDITYSLHPAYWPALNIV